MLWSDRVQAQGRGPASVGTSDPNDRTSTAEAPRRGRPLAVSTRCTAVSPGCCRRYGLALSVRSQTEVDAQGAVELGDERGRQLSQPFADSLDVDRAELLGLCLRVARQAGLAGWKENLERVDPRDVRGDRYNRDDSPAKPGGRGVCRVVADDDGGASLGGFRSSDRGPAPASASVIHLSRCRGPARHPMPVRTIRCRTCQTSPWTLPSR